MTFIISLKHSNHRNLYSLHIMVGKTRIKRVPFTLLGVFQLKTHKRPSHNRFTPWVFGHNICVLEIQALPR
jgi:hypothetical protein